MLSLQILLVATLYATSVSANCIHGTHLHRRQDSEEGTVEVSNFGYSDLQGPMGWASLDSENEACAISTSQSPIILDDSIPYAEESPEIDIPDVDEAQLANIGSSLEVVVEGTTTFDGVDYALQQFHFHTPSEHRINDEYFPVEIHMVHEADDGTIAIIAIPFQLNEDGDSLELLDQVIENIEDIREPGTVTTTGSLDFSELTEAIQTRSLFQYTGSLSSPPCTEGLIYLVMEEPLDMSVKVFNTLKSVIKFNARYSQNKLGDVNLIQVASQDSQLNCDIVGSSDDLDFSRDDEEDEDQDEEDENQEEADENQDEADENQDEADENQDEGDENQDEGDENQDEGDENQDEGDENQDEGDENQDEGDENQEEEDEDEDGDIEQSAQLFAEDEDDLFAQDPEEQEEEEDDDDEEEEEEEEEEDDIQKPVGIFADDDDESGGLGNDGTGNNDEDEDEDEDDEDEDEEDEEEEEEEDDTKKKATIFARALGVRNWLAARSPRHDDDRVIHSRISRL